MIQSSCIDDEKIILNVRFYRTDSGKEPVREWLKALSVSDRKTVGEDIKTVQFGWPLGMPLIRKIEAGIWEVRSSIKDGIARVFFTVQNSQMILIHAITKKTQKIPENDVALTRKRLNHIKAEDRDDE